MAKEKFATREEIAEILGVDVRTITNYVRAHSDFPNRVDGKHRRFPVARCVAWKIDHDVASAIAAMAPPPPQTLVDAEKRKAIADAEISELKVMQMRAEVVPIADSIREVERAFTAVRSRVASVAGEYGPRFLNLSTIPEAVAKLRELAATIIAELPAAIALLDEEIETEPAESGGDEVE